MLRRISIENFKGVGSRIDVDLKPVTLLFGPNSAGKSSVLHAMHYAHAVLELGDAEVGRTRLGGDIDLGGFGAFVHDHDLDAAVTVAFEFEPDPEGALGNAAEYLRREFKSVGVELRVRWSSVLRRPLVDRYAVAFDSEPLAELGCSIDGANVWLTNINLENPILGNEMEDDEPKVLDQRVSCLPGRRMALPRFGESLMLAGQRRDIRARLDDRERSRSVSRSGAGSRTHSVSGSRSGSRSSSGSGFGDGRGDGAGDGAGSGSGDGSGFGYGDGYGSGRGDGSGYGFGGSVDPDDDFYMVIDDLVTSAGEALRGQLERFRYIGPLRQSPPRHFQAPKRSDEARWAHGLGAWDALTRDDILRVDVSRWLGDEARLDTGYTIAWHSYREFDEDTFYRMQVAAQNLELDETFLRLTASLPERGRLVVTEREKHLQLAPCDLGEGIAQVVPVIVAALARTMVTSSGSEEPVELVAIEQPELHIHPRMQVVLGDLFLSQCSDRQFLVETHSEHLMLRLLRRIRETSQGELPPDAPSATTDSVAVLYVAQVDGTVKVTPLRVSDDGDFADPWPEGFFSERREELF